MASIILLSTTFYSSNKPPGMSRPFQASYGSDTLWARVLDLPLHLFIEMGALLVAGITGLMDGDDVSAITIDSYDFSFVAYKKKQ